MNSAPPDREYTPCQDHIPGLDGLRGIAALLVLWDHLPETLGGPLHNKIKALVWPGFMGVDIFFVLSGFLITRILLTDRQKGRPLKNFLIRRFLRIFPIYYLTILVLLFAAPGIYLLWCAFYLSNIYFSYHPVVLPLHHTWSLSVEEHFYLIWPLFAHFLSVSRSRRVALFGLIPLAFVSAIVILVFQDKVPAHGLIYTGTLCRASSLALGASFAYSEAWLRRDIRHLGRVIAVLGAIAVISLPFHLVLPGEWKSLARMTFFSSFSGITVLSVIGLSDARVRAARVLSSGVLPYCGRISYGIYLYHYPIYTAFHLISDNSDEVPTTVLPCVLAVVATMGTAIASYHLIERPILRFKDRFRGAAPLAGRA